MFKMIDGVTGVVNVPKTWDNYFKALQNCCSTDESKFIYHPVDDNNILVATNGYVCMTLYISPIKDLLGEVKYMRYNKGILYLYNDVKNDYPAYKRVIPEVEMEEVKAYHVDRLGHDEPVDLNKIFKTRSRLFQMVCFFKTGDFLKDDVIGCIEPIAEPVEKFGSSSKGGSKVLEGEGFKFVCMPVNKIYFE